MLLKALDKDPNLIQPRLLLSEIYEKEKSFLKAVEQYKILMMMNNSKLNYNIKIKEMESKLESEKKNLIK